jgi:hypothetical protein
MINSQTPKRPRSRPLRAHASATAMWVHEDADPTCHWGGENDARPER